MNRVGSQFVIPGGFPDSPSEVKVERETEPDYKLLGDETITNKVYNR